MASHLHWADYLIFVGFLAISLAIGIYHSLTGGRQKTTAEFIMANRKLKVIPTAISLLVSFYSAISMLGLTAEMYSYGIQYLIFGNLSSAVGIIIVERIIVPWLHPLKLVSVSDYFDRRYTSTCVRMFGASLGILAAVLYMGVALYAPSAALQSATGLSLSVSIPVMAVLAITYTALGGMRAVVWADVFQFLAMVVGIAAILFRGLMKVGGIADVFKLSGVEGRLVFANLSFDPRERHTVWSFLIAASLNMTNCFGLTQSSVQRFCAVDKLSKARITMLLSLFICLVMDTTCCIIGLIVLAYYSSIKCDPLANNDISNPNQLLPNFVTQIFADSPGFAGLFLSTLYGGALSSVSSSLSGSAANCWENILKWKLDHLPESRKVLINKFLVALFGALSVGMAFFAAFVPGPVTQVSLAMVGSVYGPLFAFFILGGVSRHANWKGVLVGGIVGVSSTLWLGLGSMTVRYTYPLPPVSVEHCPLGDGNLTFIPNSPNFTSYSFLRTSVGIEDIEGWNQTTETPQTVTRHKNQLRGLENFYAVSYLWVLPFGAMVTAVVGIIASLITRDKELEARVDERLLLCFNGCRWEGNEKKEYMNGQTKVSLRETELSEVGATCVNQSATPENESLRDERDDDFEES